MQVSPPDPPPTDGVVTVRPWQRGDVDAIRAAIDGDEEITRWLELIPQPYTAQDARAWIETAELSWRDGSGYPFAIVDAASGELLGGIGIRWNDVTNAVGEVGYWARREARGRGVTTRALGLVTEWALTQAGCERLVLRADVDNLPSQRVAERAGFVREGIERSARFNPRRGCRVDFVVYSRLPSD